MSESTHETADVQTQEATPPRAGTESLSEWFRIRREPIALLESLRSVGDIIHWQAGPAASYMILHPDYVKDVLVTNHRKFSLTEAWQETAMLFGKGLLHSEGEFHKRQRRLMNPAFHHMRIAAYGRIMTDWAERTSNRWKDGEEVNVQTEMMELALGVVCKALFDMDVEGPDVAQLREALNTLFSAFRVGTPIASMLRNLPLASNKRMNEAVAQVDEFIYGMIEERRRSGEDPGDLLSMLLQAEDEDGERMTDRQIRDECVTIGVAGHETTSNAMSWTWYLLAEHPDVEAKLHAELDQVLGGRQPTVEDLPALSYTSKVLHEAMRLYPPAWMLMRQAVEDHEIGGYQIGVGQRVLMFPYLMHRDERWWPEPERFDPDRWNDESESQRPKYAYVPFGAGPRMCIGENFAWMEAILVIAALAPRWRLRLAPGQTVVAEPRVNLRPKGGLPMRLEARSS
jgi:cytochrome P450